MSRGSPPVERVCDWVLGALVAVIVLLDGAVAVVVAPSIFSSDPASATTGPVGVVTTLLTAIGGNSVRWVLAALAVGALVAATCAVRRRSSAWPAVPVVGVPLVGLYAVTGFVLEWNQLGYRLARSLLDVTASVPLVGDFLATLLFGGVTLGRSTLVRAFLFHYAVVCCWVVVTVGILAPRRWRRRFRARVG